MIVNRLWPAGMPAAIRSIRACISAEAASFSPAAVLITSDAATGQATVAGCGQEIGPKELSSATPDTPPATRSSDKAKSPNRNPGGGSEGSGTTSSAS